jgi:hypothetical protein
MTTSYSYTLSKIMADLNSAKRAVCLCDRDPQVGSQCDACETAVDNSNWVADADRHPASVVAVDGTNRVVLARCESYTDAVEQAMAVSAMLDYGEDLLRVESVEVGS